MPAARSNSTHSKWRFSRNDLGWHRLPAGVGEAVKKHRLEAGATREMNITITPPFGAALVPVALRKRQSFVPKHATRRPTTRPFPPSRARPREASRMAARRTMGSRSSAPNRRERRSSGHPPELRQGGGQPSAATARTRGGG